ncbi:MAG: hypothetical protein EOP04_15745, partial [Proteobacteria bacterium]
MKFFPVLIFVFSCISLQAQGDPEPTHDGTVISISSNRIYGKIQDKASGKPVEAASAQLIIRDSLGKDSILRGMLTRANGDFSFDKLPDDKRNYYVRVSAIGFEPLDQPVEVSGANMNDNKFSVDLGNIGLAAAVQQLGGVTVSASRPALEMGIDRKIFNASKS